MSPHITRIALAAVLLGTAGCVGEETAPQPTGPSPAALVTQGPTPI